MKRLASVMGTALLQTCFALSTSHSANAQAPAKSGNPLPAMLGGIEWESGAGTVVIQRAGEHESFVVTVLIEDSVTNGCPRDSSMTNAEQSKAIAERLTTVSEQLRVWVLTDDGGALVRSKAPELQPAGSPALSGCSFIGSVSYTFRWTPAMKISAAVLKVGDRSKSFSLTAN